MGDHVHMDNPTYVKDLGKVNSTELKVVSSNGTSTPSASVTNDSAIAGCSPEVCIAARQKYAPPDLSGSPWHQKKTKFLVGLLVILLVWIIIFTTLSQLDIL